MGRARIILVICPAMFVLSGGCSIISAQETDQPTAERVIEDFIEALGGEMAVSNFESCRLTGRCEGSISGDFEYLYRDGSFVLVADFERMGRTGLGTDGDRWWRIDAGKKPTLVSGRESRGWRMFAFATPVFLNWLEFDGKLELLGATEFDDQLAWQVRFTIEDDMTVDRYFDQETGLLIGADYTTDDNRVTWTYEFEDVDGVMWVSRTESKYYTWTIHDWEFDVEIDDELLAGPDDH